MAIRSAGAKLLRALGVKGDEAELRSASEEFSGHGANAVGQFSDRCVQSRHCLP